MANIGDTVTVMGPRWLMQEKGIPGVQVTGVVVRSTAKAIQVDVHGTLHWFPLSATRITLVSSFVPPTSVPSSATFVSSADPLSDTHIKEAPKWDGSYTVDSLVSFEEWLVEQGLDG